MEASRRSPTLVGFGEHRIVGTFYAYFDESGTHQEGTFIVGGWFAKDAEWDQFNKEWIRLNHGRDFHARTPPDRHTIALLSDLVVAHALRGLLVSIDKKAYDSVTDSKFRALKGSAYTYAVQHCALKVLCWRNSSEHNSWPVSVVFDRGHKDEGHCNRELKKIRKYLTEETKDGDKFDFLSDRGLPPLQAADLLSNFAYKRRTLRKENDVMSKIVASGKCDFDRITTTQIKEVVEDYNRCRAAKRA